ncbi:hypothetical protein [Haliangium sp.]|uniref:polysaccharide deacetylase WbmS family protein n=1 Tax=Haliangium sp. TaxID=2663208 RepID=UPI003D12D48F
MGSPRICFSFDIDWAPEFMIDELAALMSEHARPFTVFCTHDSPATRRLLAVPGCETALHPNFLAAFGSDPSGADLHQREADVLDRLMASFPDARGVRNHALYYHSRLLALFHGRGVEYLSNDLRFLAADTQPYRDWSGLVRVPIYWEDDVHCVYFDGRFELDVVLPPESVGPAPAPAPLRVFNFHPVHVFLNTCDLSAYQRAKPHLHDRARAEHARHPGAGVATLLRALLAATPAAQCASVADVARDHAAAAPYRGRYPAYLARTGAVASPVEQPKQAAGDTPDAAPPTSEDP